MIAELAVGVLSLAVLCALLTAAAGLLGKAPDARFAPRMAMVQCLLVSAAFAALVHSYVVSDFSVMNVTENSHTAKPLLYKITGTWGNHEGSMLLWIWVLALFAAAYGRWRGGVAAPSRDATLGLVSLLVGGFLVFLLFTSNPFERLLPPPVEGNDLNPLLQDIGLALHPPLLYLGYVGFSVVFAMAVGALVAREPIDSRWARRVQPWALVAWSFLTAGIGLGSWWAYRELGWGGWWFWDPVENVSLLPWLSGTALIHCLLVLGKRPVLQNWTLLLAIATFTFSLLGTFLVRSGLLTSVHSFASDPTRGLYVLAFVGVVTGGSLWLYALRYPRPSPPDFEPVSREGGVMVNNLLLATLCATVFLGIIYPLLMQVFAMPSVSVGAPYYNAVVVPICLPLLLAAGIAPLVAWQRAAWKATRRLLRHALAAALVAALLAALLQWPYLSTLPAQPMALLAGVAGIWMLGATAAYGLRLWRRRAKWPEWGMVLAHGGLGVFALAAAFATAGRVEMEYSIHPGETVRIGGYEAKLAALDTRQHANYITKRATVELTATDNSAAFTLHPETRFYPSRGMETAESSIDGGPRRDVYTAVATATLLGNSSTANEAVILRIYVIPAMFWLWVGFVSATFGGMLAAFGYFRAIRMSTQSKGK